MAYTDLTSEAIWLARTINALLPKHAETLGLLSLMLFCDARATTRRGICGEYIPFDEQATEKWDRVKIGEAESLLRTASERNEIGPFQLEAAIQSAHTFRRLTGTNNWNEILQLYKGLLASHWTIGGAIGFVSAVAETDGPDSALWQLESLDHIRISTHLPYWALRAELLTRLHRFDEAVESYRRAIGLTSDPAVRSFLQERSKLDRKI